MSNKNFNQHSIYRVFTHKAQDLQEIILKLDEELLELDARKQCIGKTRIYDIYNEKSIYEQNPFNRDLNAIKDKHKLKNWNSIEKEKSTNTNFEFQKKNTSEPLEKTSSVIKNLNLVSYPETQEKNTNSLETQNHSKPQQVLNELKPPTVNQTQVNLVSYTEKLKPKISNSRRTKKLKNINNVKIQKKFKSQQSLLNEFKQSATNHTEKIKPKIKNRKRVKKLKNTNIVKLHNSNTQTVINDFKPPDHNFQCTKVSSKYNLHPSASANIFTVNKITDGNSKILKILNDNVLLVSSQNKIFAMYGGYDAVRKALVRRGWLEKLTVNRLISQSIKELLPKYRPGNEYEVAIKSKLLNGYPANFIWQRSSYNAMYKYNSPFRNRLERDLYASFTTKDGLIKCIEKWNMIKNIKPIKAPRFHRMDSVKTQLEFLKDYRITYCFSFIKFFIEKYKKSVNELFDQFATYSLYDIWSQAMDKIVAEVQFREKNKISSLLHDDFNDWNGKWMKFFHDINDVMNGKIRFKTVDDTILVNYVNEMEQLLERAKAFWPSLITDGNKNLWILKPAASCRGIGIVLKSNLDDILSFIRRQKRFNYIIQKYIERPLLIYKTKFDIRQYVLVTINNWKINVWSYKNCYLRFSSQEYDLNKLHESIHITNNAIQRKYKNGKRCQFLPNHNMWALKDFKRYLTAIAKKNVWEEKIYPDIKHNIIAVILSSAARISIVKNTFELFGYDFLIDENFDTTLIEINATPDMHHSTPVTTRICPAVLEDIIKVVVDCSGNPKANTGDFELILRFDPNDVENVIRNSYLKKQESEEEKIRKEKLKMEILKKEKLQKEKFDIEKSIIKKLIENRSHAGDNQKCFITRNKSDDYELGNIVDFKSKVTQVRSTIEKPVQCDQLCCSKNRPKRDLNKRTNKTSSQSTVCLEFDTTEPSRALAIIHKTLKKINKIEKKFRVLELVDSHFKSPVNIKLHDKCIKDKQMNQITDSYMNILHTKYNSRKCIK